MTESTGGEREYDCPVCGLTVPLRLTRDLWTPVQPVPVCAACHSILEPHSQERTVDP
jgi:tRNA(Ile2) C34 agmatinyltransferase TiaS